MRSGFAPTEMREGEEPHGFRCYFHRWTEVKNAYPDPYTHRLSERGRLEMFGRVVDTVYNGNDGHKDFHPVGRWAGEGGRPWVMEGTSPWSLSKLWHDEIQRDAVPSNDHKQLKLQLEGITVIMTSLGVDHRKQVRYPPKPVAPPLNSFWAKAPIFVRPAKRIPQRWPPLSTTPRTSTRRRRRTRPVDF